MGSRTGRRRLWLGIVMMVIPWGLGNASVTAAAPWTGELPACAKAGGQATSPPAPLRPRLRWLLDERGRLKGHRLESTSGNGIRMALGRIAFLDGPFGDRWVFADAAKGTTHLRIMDGARSCVEADILIDGLVFHASLDPDGTAVVHDLVDPGSRHELGVWRRPLIDLSLARRILPGIDSDHPVGRVWANTFAWGQDGVLVARSCGEEGCVTRTARENGGAATSGGVGAVVMGADPPRVDPRPVPETGPATWEPDAHLTYRWAPAEPSGWVRRAVNDAADDANASRGSRAARFAYSDSGDDTVGLEANMTGPCVAALACAHGVIPSWWQIRIRPHGTQVNWGTVRWCQAYDDPPYGCYDLEHVMLHEFGHIEGLAHPEGHGFRLGVLETVMASVPPQRNQTGWNLHRFGPCDVARLQRRYDVPSATTPMAQCDRVDAQLTLDSSDDSIGTFQPVTITATLRVRDRDTYDRLGGNRLSGRDVIIERRSRGSGEWTTYEAERGSAAGTYVLSFRLSKTTDFRASFGRPADEGLTGAESGVITVTVGPCTEGPCPEAGPSRSGQE